MQDIQMFPPQALSNGIHLLGSYVPVPGFGVLPINAYLLTGAQPTLVDAGAAVLQADFMTALRSTIDVRGLRWLWLTHTDPDHIGALAPLLAEAPELRVVTTYLGMGKLNLQRPMDPSRVHLLNPGQTLNVGDRRLRCLRPPIFDAPETTCLFDEGSRTLFSADAFGAVLSQPAQSAESVAPEALREGSVAWTTVDSPWIHRVSDEALEAELKAVAALSPATVLSAHLPPATGITPQLLENLRLARGAVPFVGPDQAAMMAMMAA